MNDVQITCRPGDGILRVSADTIAALDDLAEQLTSRLEHIADTIPAGTPWQIDLAIGRTPTDTVHIRATPATNPTPEEETAA